MDHSPPPPHGMAPPRPLTQVKRFQRKAKEVECRTVSEDHPCIIPDMTVEE